MVGDMTWPGDTVTILGSKPRVPDSLSSIPTTIPGYLFFLHCVEGGDGESTDKYSRISSSGDIQVHGKMCPLSPSASQGMEHKGPECLSYPISNFLPPKEHISSFSESSG